MFRLLVLSALVAMAVSDNCCSMEDRKAVLHLWESVWSAEFTGRRITIAKSAFLKMFELEPATKDLFKRVNVDNTDSPEFNAHIVRVANGVDQCINLAFDSDVQAEALVHLGTQHSGYDGMKSEYFAVLREAFAEVLPQAVPCFDRDAWNRCLKFIQDRIAHSMSS